MTQDSQARYNAIADDLSSLFATKSQMFGMPCLKIGGKAFAGLLQQAMVFKLGGDAHASALALSGAHLFDPSGQRPMKEWIEVPAEHADRWPELGRRALQYVAGA
jgi:hypothetical protein